MNKITLYRDDSTTTIVYIRVKHFFWTANNTVLVIAQYSGDGDEHHYIHWPRERFCWFRHEKLKVAPALESPSSSAAST